MSKASTFIGKLAGPIAIVSGGYGVISGVVEMAKDWKTMSAEKKGLAIANGVASVLTVAGGVAMLFPGGQVVGGVLLGVSGLITVGAMVYEYREAIATGLTVAGKAIAEGVSTAAKTVAKGVSNVATTVANGVVDAAKTVANGVSNVAKTVGNGIVNAAKTIGNSISSFFSKL